MPHWSNGDAGDEWDTWDKPARSSSNVSSEAFVEELTTSIGGYSKFFRTLVRQYLGWWAAVLVVPMVFLDHHRCEAQLSFFEWLIYAATVCAMVAMAVLLELSVVQQIGLLKPGELNALLSERQWQIALVSTVLWKLDTYTDVAFIFIAKDCGSQLWWASLATFAFGVVFGQLLLNTCFACTDCDKELPRSFGFILFDFKLVNTAVRDVLPFDPDASDLPIAKPVTLRTSGHLVGMEKVVGDVAQVSIQIAFLHNTQAPQSFVLFSVIVGMIHGTIALVTVIRECVQDEWDMQKRKVQLGTALMPGAQLSAISQISFSNTSMPRQTSGSKGTLEASRPLENTPLNSPKPVETSGSHLPHLSGREIGAQQIGKSMVEIPDLL